MSTFCILCFFEGKRRRWWSFRFFCSLLCGHYRALVKHSHCCNLLVRSIHVFHTSYNSIRQGNEDDSHFFFSKYKHFRCVKDLFSWHYPGKIRNVEGLFGSNCTRLLRCCLWIFVCTDTFHQEKEPLLSPRKEITSLHPRDIIIMLKGMNNNQKKTGMEERCESIYKNHWDNAPSQA